MFLLTANNYSANHNLKSPYTPASIQCSCRSTAAVHITTACGTILALIPLHHTIIAKFGSKAIVVRSNLKMTISVSVTFAKRDAREECQIAYLISE